MSNKLVKKIASVGLSVTTAVWLSGAVMIIPTASAQTVDLNALLLQIQQLQAAIAQLQSQSGGMTGGVSTACSFTRNLTVGSTGDDVKCLQQYLNAAGYKIAATGPGSPGNESTYFGSLTRAALAKWQQANGISPAAGYFGPVSRAKYTAMADKGQVPVQPGQPPVSVPASGLALSLAAGNPLSASIPKGSTGVTFLKFNIAGNGTVNTITVKRTGAGATTDFDNVYLYEGATRLTSGRSINSSTHEANFTNLNLAVSGVRTLSVVADIKSTAAAANRNAFQVSAVSADGGVTVSNVPLSGNEMTISGTTAGSIILEKTGSLTNPNIGQSGAQVSQFRVTASNEDVKIYRIALFSAGTTSKSNLSNFVLKEFTSGNTLATAAGVNARDLVVFEFATPYEVKRGESKSFSVYADIGGGAKKDETVKLYIDETTDVYAVGQQYGQGVTVTKTAFDSDSPDHHTLTFQGATVTITFNGPNAGDVKRNGKDLTLFDFTIASANNIEIRNLRFTVTASTTQAGVDDFKVVDVNSGVTVAGPKDDASGSVVFSDVFTVSAGQSRRLKVTGDTDTNWLNGETIRVELDAFAANDIKNLDNNQFLTISTEVSPSTDITGNLQTVKAATLEVTKAGSPASDSFVKGTKGVPFLGIGLRAVADDIKITTIKLTASPSSGSFTVMQSDVQSVKLFDGQTQVGTVKSITGATGSSAGTVTFDNLNFVIPKGQSKTLVVKADISSSATVNNKPAFRIANVADTTGVDIVAVDTEGNEPTYSGDNVNDDVTTNITILSSGAMNIAIAPDDSESKAGILVAGTNGVVLSKFNFTATNESLTVKKLRVYLDTDDATNANAGAGLTDEVLRVYLYDGGSVVGSTSGYTPSGTDGVVTIEDLAWTVNKDQTKTLTVKADLATIANGADTGTELRAHIHKLGFEATGSATTITAFNLAAPASDGYAATGNVKVVYKTYPTVEWVAASGSTLNTPLDLEIARFKVKAHSAERIEWGAIGLQLTLLNASFSDAQLTLRDITNSQDITVGTQAPTTSSLDLTGDSTKSVILYLSTPQQIAAGGERVYAVKITATPSQFGTANETETLTTRLVLHNDSSSTNIANAATFSFGAGARVDATLDSADNAFVWSDFSNTNHSLSTTDWANGVYVETFPSNTWTLSR